MIGVELILLSATYCESAECSSLVALPYAADGIPDDASRRLALAPTGILLEGWHAQLSVGLHDCRGWQPYIAVVFGLKVRLG